MDVRLMSDVKEWFDSVPYDPAYQQIQEDLLALCNTIDVIEEQCINEGRNRTNDEIELIKKYSTRVYMDIFCGFIPLKRTKGYILTLMESQTFSPSAREYLQEVLNKAVKDQSVQM